MTDHIAREAQARVGEPTIEPEPSDPTQCSGEAGFCPEHGYHRHSLKQPGEEHACIHPEGYDGECPCPPNCGCCKATATAPDPDQFRADAEAWRQKAVRRALTISRLRGTIDACIDLVDEAVTDRSPRGDGYRAAISYLREVLQEFGHLDGGSGTVPEPAHDAGPDVAECAAADRNWDAQKAGE